MSDLEEPDPGDPVCWLHRLCPDCGAVPTGDGETVRCWRCGTPVEEWGARDPTS